MGQFFVCLLYLVKGAEFRHLSLTRLVLFMSGSPFISLYVYFELRLIKVAQLFPCHVNVSDEIRDNFFVCLLKTRPPTNGWIISSLIYYIS